MKKQKGFVFSLSLLLSFLCLPSCSGRDNDKVLLHKKEGIQSTIRLNSAEELNSLVRYESSLVMVTQTGCEHCEAQLPVLNQFIQETETVIYSIDYSAYKEAYEAESNSIGTYANLLPRVFSTPTYLFYGEGSLKEAKVPTSDMDLTGMKEMIYSYSELIPLYQLNDTTYNSRDGYTYISNSEELEEAKNLDTLGYSTTELDKKIQDEEKITVLYTWRRCLDCKDYRLSFFDDFLLKSTKKIYYYEIDGYYLLKRQSDETLRDLGLNMWASFSEKYHLITDAYYNTDILGNKAGFAPTMVTYEKGSYSSMDVYLNEVGYKTNDDGTLSYTMAFHEDVLALKSDTKVSDGDSDSQKKARSELSSKARTIDLEKSKEYLSSL